MEGNITGVNGFHGNGALADVLPGFDYLLDHLERSKAVLEGRGEFPSLRICVNLAWKKLDEYYKLTDDSAVYLVATILDPRLKMAYFEHAWADNTGFARQSNACIDCPFEFLVLIIHSMAVLWRQLRMSWRNTWEPTVNPIHFWMFTLDGFIIKRNTPCCSELQWISCPFLICRPKLNACSVGTFLPFLC